MLKKSLLDPTRVHRLLMKLRQLQRMSHLSQRKLRLSSRNYLARKRENKDFGMMFLNIHGESNP